MKNLILLSAFLLCCSSAAFSQTYKVGDEINYFNGLDWIESQIVKIEGGKYFVYTNREKSKTKWVTAEDIEPFIYDYNKITEIKFEIIESSLKTIYKEGDLLRINMKDSWYESELLKIGENDLFQVYSDTTKSSIIWVNEKDVILLDSKSEVQYKTVEKSVTYIYKLDEIVEYLNGTTWVQGKIEKFNDASDVLINGVWLKNDKIRKLKK